MNLATVIGLVASLLGAWLGAAFAVRRFKREHGFDRRLEWLERQITLFSETRLHLQRLNEATEAQDQSCIAEVMTVLEVDNGRLETSICQIMSFVNADLRLVALLSVMQSHLSGILKSYLLVYPRQPLSNSIQAVDDLLIGSQLLSLELRNQLRLSGFNFNYFEAINSELDSDPDKAYLQLRKLAGLDTEVTRAWRTDTNFWPNTQDRVSSRSASNKNWTNRAGPPSTGGPV